MRAHEQAPPDPGFRDRLRGPADAAAAMRDGHARALEAGLAWRPVADSERARPPYELRPGTGRRGPAELWTRFDAAVQRLNEAGASDNLSDVVDAYAAVAHAASDWPTRYRLRASNAEAAARPTSAGEHGSSSHPQLLLRVRVASCGRRRRRGRMTAAHASMSPAAGRAARGPRSGGFDPRRRLGRDLLHAGSRQNSARVMSPAWR